MLNALRAPLRRVLDPVGERLARAGVSPDAVTVVGTVGVSLAALAFFPRGSFLVGTLVITLFVFSDMVDGAVARAGSGGSVWGAFLDSSLDRVADAAVFGSIALWYAGGGDDPVLTAVTLWCLVAGSLTSYVKARAESLGLDADVGIAERPERLVTVLLFAGLAGLFDAPWLLAAALWVLAVATTVTVGQRLAAARRSAAGRLL